MARKKARPAAVSTDAYEYSESTRQTLEDDAVYALEHLLLVEHRDQPGKLIPFKVNAAQRRLHDLIEMVRALRVIEQIYKLAPQEKKRALSAVGGQSPWRFSVNVKKVAAAGVGKGLRALRAIGFEINDGPVNITVGKCRRAGVSTFIEALGFMKCNFSPGFRALVMAHKGDNAKKVFRYTRSFYKFWSPKWLAFRSPTEYAARTGYTWEHDSAFEVSSSGGDNSARGDQYDYHHFSETAYYDDYTEVNAALSGAPPYAWAIEESTGNGPQGGFHQRWMGGSFIDDVLDAYDGEDADFLSSWNGYVRYFFSWLEDPEYRLPCFDWEAEHIMGTLDEYERALMKAFPETSVEQLKWRRHKIEHACTNNPAGLPPEQYFEQEFPATWEDMFQSTGRKWFDQRKLKKMLLWAKSWRPELYCWLETNTDPQRVLRGRHNCIFHKAPDPRRTYVIGADASQGLRNGDWSDALVLDRTDGLNAEEAAFLHVKVPGPEFGELLCMLAEIYNDAFLVPEVNGPGLATCQRIIDNRYPHIYHRATLDQVRNVQADVNGFRFGFHTNNATKARIMSESQQALRDGRLLLRSTLVIQQHMSYESVDGRLRAPTGEHDDAVVAAALAWFGHRSGAPPVSRRDAREATKDSAVRDPIAASIWQATLAKIGRDALRGGGRRGLRDARKGAAEAARRRSM